MNNYKNVNVSLKDKQNRKNIYTIYVYIDCKNAELKLYGLTLKWNLGVCHLLDKAVS